VPEKVWTLGEETFLSHAGKIAKFLYSGIKGITGFLVEVWYFL